MRLILILLALSSISIVLPAQQAINQTDSNNLKQGKWIGKFFNGTIRYEGYFKNNKPAGEWKRFHQNSKLKANLSYFPNSNKVTAEIYDTDGLLISRGNYSGTQKDSIWTYYDKNIIIARENYVKGLKNGLSYFYSPDGKVIKETNWLNGKLNGLSREYYSSGSKKSEINYVNGKRHGDFYIYFESGQIQIEGKYDLDQCADKWKYYYPNGTVKFKLEYRDGILLNPEKVDSLQMKEFNSFDRAKGRLKDPEHYIDNPQEYIVR